MKATLLAGPLVFIGMNTETPVDVQWATTCPAAVWVTQTRDTAVYVACWPTGGYDLPTSTHYRSVTTDIGLHGHIVPPGDWSCAMYSESVDNVITITVEEICDGVPKFGAAWEEALQ